MSSVTEKAAQELLSLTGVEINGNNPWDMQVNHPETFARIMRDHSLGLGEAYMDGWWHCEQLDEFICRVLKTGLAQKVKKNNKLLLRLLWARLVNLQSRSRSQQVADVHYNLDNDLYELMLGPTMSYTCAYWKDAKTLDQAQDAKHELICQKLQLKKGEKVLELGCGWAGFAEYAAKHYGVEMTSINISKEQVKYGKARCKDLPVTFHLCDYRDVSTFNPSGQEFDKVVSIGMCEHVGHKNYRTFLKIAHDNMKDDGLFLLHTIGGNQVTNTVEPWHGKYIFPNGMLPAAQQLSVAMEGLLVMEDWHNFGPYYDLTLMAWHENFVANWDKLKDRYDERFYRMWSFYLLSCAGMFRARDAQLWQIVLSKHGRSGAYISVR